MPETYTVQLSFRPLDDGGPLGRPLLEEMAKDVLHWARTEPSVKVFPHYGQWVDDAFGTFKIRGDAADALEWWEMEWSRPDPRGRSINWLSEARLATRGDQVESRISVSIRAQPGRILPENATVERPNIVTRLVTKFHATYYGDRVDAMPLSPLHAHAIERFVAERLENPNRRLPIVILSTSPGSTKPLLLPRNVADRLVGLAEVVSLADSNAAYELTNIIGRDLSCFNGAARLYWPNFNSITDEFRDHRLWTPARIRDRGERDVISHIFNTLCPRVARAAGDFSIWNTVVSGINDHTRTQFQDRINDLRKETKENDELADYFNIEHQKAEKERDDAIARADDLDKQLEEKERIIDKLEGDLMTAQENLRTTQAELHKTLQTQTKETKKMDINSVIESVHAAQELPHLRFIPTAYRSAEKSIYTDPISVYDAFIALEDLAIARLTGSVGSIENWLKNRSIDYKAHESKTTRPDRWFTVDGERVLMEEHLAFGTGTDPRHCLRVHMAWSDEEGKWLIGHVGEHLRNTKT